MPRRSISIAVATANDAAKEHLRASRSVMEAAAIRGALRREASDPAAHVWTPRRISGHADRYIPTDFSGQHRTVQQQGAVRCGHFQGVARALHPPPHQRAVQRRLHRKHRQNLEAG